MISRRDHEFYTVGTYAETELSRRVERRKKGEIKGKGRNLGRRDSASHIFIPWWLIESVNNEPRCPDFQIINRISSSFQFEWSKNLIINLEFNEAFTELFDCRRECKKDREIDFFPLRFDRREGSQLEKKRERLLSVKRYTPDGPSLR